MYNTLNLKNSLILYYLIYISYISYILGEFKNPRKSLIIRHIKKCLVNSFIVLGKQKHSIW